MERFARKGWCPVSVDLSGCLELATFLDIIVVSRDKYIENDGSLLRAESWIKHPVKGRLHLIDALIKCLIVLRKLLAIGIFFPEAWS